MSTGLGVASYQLLRLSVGRFPATFCPHGDGCRDGNPVSARHSAFTIRSARLRVFDLCGRVGVIAASLLHGDLDAELTRVCL